MTHNTALHITQKEMFKREFQDLSGSRSEQNVSLDFSNPNGPMGGRGGMRGGGMGRGGGRGLQPQSTGRGNWTP
eukprot:1531659-Rhodomonas_salina.2